MKRLDHLAVAAAMRRSAFPPLEQALRRAGRTARRRRRPVAERLLAAYRRGIFPWYSPGQPVLWWSPDPRAVLFPEEFRCSRSLAKTLRNGGFAIARRPAISPA